MLKVIEKTKKVEVEAWKPGERVNSWWRVVSKKREREREVIKEKAEKRDWCWSREEKRGIRASSKKRGQILSKNVRSETPKIFEQKQHNQIIHSDGKTIIESERREGREKQRKRKKERKKDSSSSLSVNAFSSLSLSLSLCFLPPSSSIPIIHIFLLLSLLTLICPCKMYWEEENREVEKEWRSEKAFSKRRKMDQCMFDVYFEESVSVAAADCFLSIV